MEQFGPYRLEALIGRGGMGEVHRAFDTRRNRHVALKRLPPELASDTQFQLRFRRESELAARLAEPHVIPIHDFGEIDGRLYIDMRLVSGMDLSELLGDAGPLPATRAVAVVAQVASALDAAHAEGLVHRDIKPSNVLVTPGDFAYLVDFGVAREVEGEQTALTTTGSTVGTLAYLAPERFEGRGDHRVDVYALACVLHEALTGRKPFPATSFPALIHAHLNLAPPRPSEAVAGLPRGLDDVVACGMAKDPGDRYPSAGALAEAARAALGAGDTTAVRPVAEELVAGPGADGAAGSWPGYTSPPSAPSGPGRGSPRETAYRSGPPPAAPGWPPPAGPDVPGAPWSPGAPPPARRRRGLPVLVALAGVLALGATVLAVVLLRPTDPTGSTAGATAPAAGAAPITPRG